MACCCFCFCCCCPGPGEFDQSTMANSSLATRMSGIHQDGVPNNMHFRNVIANSTSGGVVVVVSPPCFTSTARMLKRAVGRPPPSCVFFVFFFPQQYATEKLQTLRQQGTAAQATRRPKRALEGWWRSGLNVLSKDGVLNINYTSQLSPRQSLLYSPC